MNTFVALLRGINVGGNNIIKMEALRSVFEKMGFEEVRTYIQSGNVIFKSSKKDQNKLAQFIQKQLKQSFDYGGKVMIRSQKEIEKTVENLPKESENPDWKCNVLFLSKNTSPQEISEAFELKEEIEQMSAMEDVVFWCIEKQRQTQTRYMKLPAHKLYKEMTIRNARTTRKILEKMHS